MSDQASVVWPPRMPAAIRLAAPRLIAAQLLAAAAFVILMPRWPAIPGIREILWLTIASVPLNGAGLLVASRMSAERAIQSRMISSWNGVLFVWAGVSASALVALVILTQPLTDASLDLLRFCLLVGIRLGLVLTLGVGTLVITEPLRAVLRLGSGRLQDDEASRGVAGKPLPAGMRLVRAKPPMGRFDLEAWRRDHEGEKPFNLEATRLERYPGT